MSVFASADSTAVNRPRKADESGAVRSVQRAVRLLACLGPTQPKATLTDFTNLTGLATSTVQRLLQTLEGESVLRRLPDGRYTFGTKFIRLSIAALQGIEIYELAEPYLAGLSKLTGETANFAVLDEQDQVLYLRHSASPHAIRHAGWPGRPFATRGTAIGAALTGRVDAQGIVATRKTLEPDVTAAAAPVYGHNGDIVGAISITGPTFRIDDAALARYCDILADGARRLTGEVGGSWPHADPNEHASGEPEP